MKYSQLSRAEIQELADMFSHLEYELLTVALNDIIHATSNRYSFIFNSKPQEFKGVTELKQDYISNLSTEEFGQLLSQIVVVQDQIETKVKSLQPATEGKHVKVKQIKSLKMETKDIKKGIVKGADVVTGGIFGTGHLIFDTLAKGCLVAESGIRQHTSNLDRKTIEQQRLEKTRNKQAKALAHKAMLEANIKKYEEALKKLVSTKSTQTVTQLQPDLTHSSKTA